MVMSNNGVFVICTDFNWDLEDLIFSSKEKAREYIEGMIKDDPEYYVDIVFGDDADDDDDDHGG